MTSPGRLGACSRATLALAGSGGGAALAASLPQPGEQHERGDERHRAALSGAGRGTTASLVTV